MGRRLVVYDHCRGHCLDRVVDRHQSDSRHPSDCVDFRRDGVQKKRVERTLSKYGGHGGVVVFVLSSK